MYDLGKERDWYGGIDILNFIFVLKVIDDSRESIDKILNSVCLFIFKGISFFFKIICYVIRFFGYYR